MEEVLLALLIICALFGAIGLFWRIVAWGYERKIKKLTITARSIESLPSQEVALSEAKPVADLEAEIERWWNERYAEVDKNYEFNSMSGHYITNETIITLARHFAEWGKTQKLSPQPKDNTGEFDDYNTALLG